MGMAASLQSALGLLMDWQGVIACDLAGFIGKLFEFLMVEELAIALHPLLLPLFPWFLSPHYFSHVANSNVSDNHDHRCCDHPH
jgi:hypothetical protein